MSPNKKTKAVRADFSKARLALADVMNSHLQGIADDLVKQIVTAARSLTPSQQINAIKGTSPRGTNAYKESLRDAMSVVSLDALDKARREVPAKKNVRLSEWLEDSIQLSEFDRLPPGVQKRVLNQSNLIIDTQMGDLQKAVYFQFGSSLDSTESVDVIGQDMQDSADDFIAGSGVNAAAGTEAAQLINTARNAFFFDTDVLEEIDAFMFVNGDPVSDICQDLAGTVFAKDDPESARYFPPLHYNCKSFIVPILSGNLGDQEIEKLRPSSSKLESSINLSETPANF